MPYTALPDRRMPWDNDGTVSGYGSPTVGLTNYWSGAQAINLNDDNYVTVHDPGSYITRSYFFFFPEQREVTAYAGGPVNGDAGLAALTGGSFYGSNDSVNGLDGTFEQASLPSGQADNTTAYRWRAAIKPVSFTGGKRVLRFDQYANNQDVVLFHLYGEKVAGQTPDDVIYIDHDTTPGVEYAAPEDFGDQPLGTTVVRQFRLKNASATKTANSINVQCNDADFAISTDGTTWVVTINIASLGPGAQSATMYVRCTTPAPGNLLGPRFARIVTTVASYT